LYISKYHIKIILINGYDKCKTISMLYGDLGLGIGPIPNPQSPIPNPQKYTLTRLN